jgi:hypothetical protein
VGIERIGLAVVASIEQAYPGGEFGRDVNNMLAGFDQALGQWPASAVGALDRPQPIRPRLHVRAHRCVPALVGGEAARPEQVFLSVDDLDGGRQLVGIDSDDDLFHHTPLLPSNR